ncbi:hypothetical protein GALL_494080 [mine drainage metagenome]|uniref:Uncharacterized protein n=1 Tax=mine drainage metagenome TaxID=410659 RepID=A0A1J5PUM5_9ZZZZ
MNTTGTSKVRNSSLTASRPEEPSANWISARMRPGFLFLASATASVWVRATPITRWPKFFTRLSRSIAIKVSSSMMSTSVAISAAISRPAISARLRVSATSVPRMNATSSSEKPSSDNSRKAWRGSGVIFESRRSGGIGKVVTSGSSLIDTEFQICVKIRNSPARGP